MNETKMQGSEKSLANETKNHDEKRCDNQEAASEHHCLPPTIQQIVERYLQNVEWLDATRGRATCPGVSKHTCRSHRNDCWVFINGTPTVTCLHASCEREVAAANDKIRSAWSLYQPTLDPVALAAAKAKAAKRHALEEKARASLPEILKQFKWDVEDIENHEAKLGRLGPTAHFLQRMFKPDDKIWIGEPEDSGQPSHDNHFRSQEDWIRIGFDHGINYHYTCASTFKFGTYSRANANVLETKYLIVEGDNVLGKKPETDYEKRQNENACGAIFNWLRTSVNLELRAVVASGNKSLHGWYTMPSLEKFEELKIILPQMGCDRAMFKPTQPARLPGVVRDNGNEQKLLWIN